MSVLLLLLRLLECSAASSQHHASSLHRQCAFAAPVGGGGGLGGLPPPWVLQGVSAAATWVGLVAYLDRPRGKILVDFDSCLSVQPSSVKGAGLGLFAKKTVPQGTVLGTYPGIVIPLQQNLAKLEAYPECEAYIWRFSDNQMVIDPTNHEGVLEAFCRGGNPNMGFSKWLFSLLDLQTVSTALCRINEPPLGRDVNVVTDEDLNRRCVVFSLERTVYAGEELFIDYGLSYDRSRYGG